MADADASAESRQVENNRVGDCRRCPVRFGWSSGKEVTAARSVKKEAGSSGIRLSTGEPMQHSFHGSGEMKRKSSLLLALIRRQRLRAMP